ncbi:methionyl-tRNA formyltransferase [Halomonas vilamensis]|uniref:Methionyl-tRNA formyltransferase n=1 Tax=Vreelandella vilamensis TaxID=531309 RepID=A0ABU1H050_9GAMM|nr:methionyl-tRNA formyltransferase [Halomonas vilamensis]MDR5897609.1 methionyl-tRNA formyltransferase [Halomonas vilamensis]
MSSLRVVFAGTPDFAAASLEALLASEHNVVGVYTQPDRPAGRGRKLTPSPVKKRALEHDLPVYQPASLKSADAQAALAALNADVMVVVAYGLLLPQAVLDIPRLGCVNVHASLLPRWRGAAPLQRAIEAEDRESGVAIMQMDAGLDTGAVLREARTPITPTTTGGELHDTLAALGATTLIDTLDAMAAGQAQTKPQPEEGVTYAAKLSKAEAELDFTQPAATLAAKIRAFNPWPVAWCALGDERLRLLMASAEEGSAPPALPGTLLAPGRDCLRIACGAHGHEVLQVTKAQLPGGKAMPVRELLNARHTHLAPGNVLGNDLGNALDNDVNHKPQGDT